MSDRVSETILLCEDDPQEQMVRGYLSVCGAQTKPPMFIVKNASRAVHGGNVDWALKAFPRELEACRKRATQAKTRLIVIVDADDKSVPERRAELGTIVEADPAIVLIPKRHIETWIRCALGDSVNEEANYKRPPLKRSQVMDAAKEVHGWARNQPAPGPICVESLRVALPAFRRLG